MDPQSKEVVKKLRELNTVIKSLDPSIRAQAFDLLRTTFLGDQPTDDHPSEPEQKHTHRKELLADSKELFLKRFEHKKPSNNVFLIAAWLYSQHGAFAISSDTLTSVASDTGLTIPERPDMTLKQAQKKGKHLFVRQGSGYKPTVHGESFLKDTYHVKKGNVPFKEETEN